ncbi:MAG: hypothetical protein ACKVP0_03175 [Pirellulaceae bacterium]
MLKLLLDENLRSDALWNAIAIRCGEQGLTNAVDIQRVGSGASPALATSDRDLLIHCELTKQILVSSDTNTMPGFLQAHLAGGKSSPGVIFLRKGQTIPELIELLLLISYAGDAAEYADQCTWVP